MTDQKQKPERALVEDLAGFPELYDNQAADDLYRALAGQVWHKDGLEGRLALSWKEAESVVNELRARAGREPLELAQSGGEGKVARSVAEALGELGWTYEPLDTSRHDPAHVERGESPPPQPDEPQDWERTAHEEAERARTGVDPPPATASTGAGGGNV